jgi:5-methylcytosine-specific restriction endonuclease McrA
VREPREEYLRKARERNARYRANNPERVRASQRRSTLAHPETHREASRRYTAKHRDRIRECHRRERLEHPERVRERKRRHYAKDLATSRVRGLAYANTRRALKAQTGSEKLGLRDLEALFRFQEGRCVYCKEPLSGRRDLDHLVPLSRGGAHALSNLAWACVPCNRRKGQKTAREFSSRAIPVALSA